MPLGGLVPVLEGQPKDVVVPPASSQDSTGCSELATESGSEETFLETTDCSLCTHSLMLNPPNASVAIRRSAYSLPSASITFKDLTFSLPSSSSRRCLRAPGGETPKAGEELKAVEEADPNLILAPCSGHFEAGQLVAIMGPSGCGKTTLLDMLAAKKSAPFGGEVLINGRPRDKLFRRIAAYVGQEDLMPAHWTVRDAIEFNATLKRQPKRAHCSLNGWTETLLAAFDLQSVAKSYIGGSEARGISGGQRRRTSLARGVAAYPSLLFCDEPTSGLSATDAETCVKALRIVTKRLGITCLVVIHQPRYEVATLFDTLVLLTSNPGRMAYIGPTSGAEAFWFKCGFPAPANMNPTDYFLDLLTPNTRLDQSATLVKAFDEHIKPQLQVYVEKMMQEQGQTVTEMLAEGGRKHCHGPYAVRFGAQLAALLRRKLMLSTRNPSALGLPLVVPVVQGVLVGYMFNGIGEKDDLLKQIMFSFCLLTMLCLAGTMSLIVLITERTLMKHEASEALYSEDASALASFLFDVPLSLLGAFLNVVIMAAFGRLEMGILTTVVSWALLLFFVYDSLFSFIGAVARDTRQAQVIATPFISIFMLFNGFIVSKADAPKPLLWIFWISPNAYAMQAIAVCMAQEFPLTGPALLDKFGYTDDTTETRTGVFVLLAMILLLRLGQQLGLRYLNNVQR